MTRRYCLTLDLKDDPRLLSFVIIVKSHRVSDSRKTPKKRRYS